jgi:hypothetical protein
MAAVTVDLAGWTTREKCGLCGIDLATVGGETHHKVFRSQGGDDSPVNLIRLCRVCHDAAHGIKSQFFQHCCASCPVLRRRGCHFGEKVTDRPVTTPKPW